MSDVPTRSGRSTPTSRNLETRRAVWRPGPSGVDPLDLVVDGGARGPAHGPGACPTSSRWAAVRAPSRPGWSRSCPGIALLAIDQSPRFVELTRERGVPAQVQDVQHLLAPDASYDVVLALWMLYHVPDLDRGLAELRRVLRPGGRLVAVTNGDEHVADLRREAGGDAVRTTFSSENGEASLRRHFELGHPPGRRDPCGLPGPRLRAGLPTLVRRGRRLDPARGRLAARVRRPRDGLRGAVTRAQYQPWPWLCPHAPQGEP